MADLFSTFDMSAIDSSYNDNMTKDEYIADIIPQLQAILNKRFPDNPSKRKIKVYKDRISFAAPCCGDSAHKSSKKRGNIILTGKFRNMYKCFNCGMHMSVQNFFKTYGQQLSLSAINYISNTTERVTDTQPQGISSSFGCLYDVEAIESFAIDRTMFRDMLGLSECTSPNFGRNYLIGRRQFSFEKFLYSVEANKLFLLNLTPNGKVFGIQVRHFGKAVDGAKYKTYNLQKIYELILRKNDVKIPDDINDLSMIFNILLINYTHPVTVTEGPMDAFLIKNAIAQCGASKNIVFPFEHRFMFDDDKTGRTHSIDKLNDGYDVFLWDKFKHEIGITSYKKLDFNDVVIWAYKNNVTLPPLDSFYSSDELDLISI